MSQVTITCIPCDNETKYYELKNNHLPMNVTFKGEEKALFGEINSHSCPFCEVKLVKTDIISAFLAFLADHKLSFKTKGEVIEMMNSEFNVIFNRQVIIEKRFLTDIPFLISKNEFELIRLVLMDIDSNQWTLQIENEESYVA